VCGVESGLWIVMDLDGILFNIDGDCCFKLEDESWKSNERCFSAKLEL